MTPRSTLYRNATTGIQIQVSAPATILIGPKIVNSFVKALHGLMESLSIKTAYVSKRGAAIDVHLIGPPFVSKHFKLERGATHE